MHTMSLPDEPPPFLGTWQRVYAAVIVYLFASSRCFTFHQAFNR